MPRSPNPAATATAFDTSDPFTYSRVMSHLRAGVGVVNNFERARRIPAPLQDRFTLINNKERGV